jgi:hypothetical protein
MERSNHVPFAPAAYREAHHDAAGVVSPPPAFECSVRSTEGVDHLGHCGVRLAGIVEHSLRGEVGGHLVPHAVTHLFIRQVGPDAQRCREIDKIQTVSDQQEAVGSQLHRHNIADEAGGMNSVDHASFPESVNIKQLRPSMNLLCCKGIRH